MKLWLRVCLVCSSGLPPIDLCCPRCWRKVMGQLAIDQKIYPKPPFPVCFLWKWERENDLVEKMIYGLKHAPLIEARHRLIDVLLQKELTLFKEGKPTSVVFPAKQSGAEDHGFHLAQMLAFRLNLPAIPLYISASDKNYRSLGREERYRLRKIHRSVQGGKRPLMIDDVYTTGATALRAWQALGEPAGFRVCVLAYKGLAPLG